MADIGFMVGGLLIVLLLNVLLWWAIFKRIIKHPVIARVVTAIAAWLIAGTLAGFGLADGGPYAWHGFGLYFLPAAIVGGLSTYLTYRKHRQEQTQ